MTANIVFALKFRARRAPSHASTQADVNRVRQGYGTASHLHLNNSARPSYMYTAKEMRVSCEAFDMGAYICDGVIARENALGYGGARSIGICIY